jgi:isopentenyldiphosphate isomerase
MIPLGAARERRATRLPRRALALRDLTREAELDEQVDWIDESGVTLASLPRSEVRRLNLLHRVTATFVFHPDGRLFVHRRTETKDVYPGFYDVAVGGTVASGESYVTNACRELAEELGIRDVPVYRLFAHRFQDRWSNSLTEVFAVMAPGPFQLQPEEVAEGFWMDIRQVPELIASGRVCPDSVQAWRLYSEQVRADGNLAIRIQQGRISPVQCGSYSPKDEGPIIDA